MNAPLTSEAVGAGTAVAEPRPAASALRGLVADLGGTNARFAIASVAPGGAVTLSEAAGLRARDYPTAEDAVRTYLAGVSDPTLDFAAMACAGPVQDGQVFLTNLGWTLSTSHLAASLDLGLDTGRIHLLNDLAAVAWAGSLLGEHDLRPIGPKSRDRADVQQVIAVLGAGTGANCSALVRSAAGDQVVLAGEAGHASFAPTDERDVEIWRRLNALYGRVSVERLASGPGTLNIYRALCEIEAVACACATPEDVSARADRGDRLASEALDRFAMALGAIAGDFALTFGAQALYLTGGLAPRLLIGERASLFRSRFDDKGRFAPYMHDIGTSVIVHPHAALIGAAHAATVFARSSG